MLNDLSCKAVIEFFKNKCESLPFVRDVLIRGTSLNDATDFVDGWSDVDLSIILKSFEEDSYERIRKIVLEAKAKFPMKISVTVVDEHDFYRKSHNHGIKPLFYTRILPHDSEFLFGRLSLSTDNADDIPEYDCYYNILYLVHDIRSNYLSVDENKSDFLEKSRHILKRTKHVVRNAIFLITNQVVSEDELPERAEEVIAGVDRELVKTVLNLREVWESLSLQRPKLMKLVSNAVMLCNLIFERVNSYMDGKSKKKIVVFTDCTDISFSEIYARLQEELEKFGTRCDIAPLVCVKEFSVINAAFSLRLLADIYAQDAIFLVIVNGTRDNPVRIFGETKNGIVFIGNNSGYFSWLIKDFGVDKLYLTKKSRDVDNRSFGGRNVQTPIAAQIAAGVPYDEIGDRCDIELLNHLDLIEGTVVHIDNFGLIKIFKSLDDDIKTASALDIYVNGQYKITARYSQKMKICKDGEWIVFEGSSLTPPLLEIARVRSENSAEELGVKIGDIITILPKEI